MTSLLQQDKVIKQGAGRDLALEAAKTRMACEVADQTRLFRVPAVLAFDPDRGRLELDRVPGFGPIWRAVACDSPTDDVWSRLGTVLALVHERLDARALPDVPAAPPWCAPQSRAVVVHGDLSTANLQLDPRSRQILMLDWSSSPHLGPCFVTAPPELDLAWLISGWMTLPRRFVRPRQVGLKAVAVLRAYQRHARQPLDVTRLADWIRKMHAIQATTRPPGWLSQWTRRRDQRRLEHFLNHELDV